MADGNNMGAEQITRISYAPSSEPRAELGYPVPKIKLEDGRRAGPSTPTLERMAQLQDAKTAGDVVITDPHAVSVDSQIKQITTELTENRGSSDLTQLLAVSSEDGEKDDSNPFSLGSGLRRAQAIVVKAYSHLKDITGLTGEDLDDLLLRLKNPKTRQKALEEVTILNSVVKTSELQSLIDAKKRH